MSGFSVTLSILAVLLGACRGQDFRGLNGAVQSIALAPPMISSFICKALYGICGSVLRCCDTGYIMRFIAMRGRIPAWSWTSNNVAGTSLGNNVTLAGYAMRDGSLIQSGKLAYSRSSLV